MGVQKWGVCVWKISDETVQQADVKSTFSPGETEPTNQLKSFTTTPKLTFRICSFAPTAFLGLQTNSYLELEDLKTYFLSTAGL